MANSRVAGVFPLGDGENFIVAEWFPDPAQIEVEMIKIADQFSDWQVPLHEARAAMIESTQIHFETQSDPYGDPWEKLSDDYYHDKVELGGFPDQILVRTGELEKRATSQEAWFVTQDAIFFNAAALPPYGPIHQEGTAEGEKAGKLAEALDVFARAQRTSSAAGITREHVETVQKGAQGLNLPQRMFIGADVDTIAEIEAIFLRHLEHTVIEHWGGSPIVRSPMGTFSGGTFPIMSFTSRGQPILRTPSGPRFGRML